MKKESFRDWITIMIPVLAIMIVSGLLFHEHINFVEVMILIHIIKTQMDDTKTIVIIKNITDEKEENH